MMAKVVSLPLLHVKRRRFSFAPLIGFHITQPLHRHPPSNHPRVQGLVWRPVSTPEEAAAALREGSRARRTASTALNAASSRSHALLSVKVRALQDGAPVTTLMHLVDLVSERSARSNGL